MAKSKATPELLNSPSALIIQGLLGLILGYALMLRALDTANSLQYIGMFVLYIFGFRCIIRAIKTHGKK